MSEIKFTTSAGGTGAPAKPNGKKVGLLVTIGIIILVLLIVVLNCFSIVNEGFIGVQYRFGKIVDADLTAGLNFRVPFIDEIVEVDTREQVYAVTTDAYTSDTQTVKELQLKLNYYYDSTKLSNIIKNIGVNNVETKLLVPNVAKVAKNEIGKVKAEELVQSRSDIQQKIQNELTTILQNNGIVVTAFALENLSFDSAFEESIQAKVIAAQDALKMENKTLEKEEEAKQVVIAAQAEADSVKIAAAAQADAISLIQEQLDKSPNYIEYLKITTWNGVLPQVMGDDVNPFVVLGSSDATNAIASTRTVTPAASADTANAQ